MEIVPLSEGEKTGAEARRHGKRVAHLVGVLGEAPSRGRHAWVGPGDHSLADGESPELLADVYAAAGTRWVADGYLTHFVVVPVDGPLPALFFGLGFGQEQVHARALEELLGEEDAVVLLAERGGESLGYVATHPADEPGLAHLPVAGTREDARGGGIGVALVAHALHRAHRDGFRTVELDWRATNLLASRFWPKRGFVQTHLRLRRDVQPTA